MNMLINVFMELLSKMLEAATVSVVMENIFLIKSNKFAINQCHIIQCDPYKRWLYDRKVAQIVPSTMDGGMYGQERDRISCKLKWLKKQ